MRVSFRGLLFRVERCQRAQKHRDPHGRQRMSCPTWCYVRETFMGGPFERGDPRSLNERNLSLR